MRTKRTIAALATAITLAVLPTVAHAGSYSDDDCRSNDHNTCEKEYPKYAPPCYNDNKDPDRDRDKDRDRETDPSKPSTPSTSTYKAPTRVLPTT